MTGSDIHTLSGAYVLDAVDDVERAAFDRHLAGCESCTVEVVEFRAAAARLADGTWSVPAPPLRAQVLGRAAATRQLRRVRHRRSGSTGTQRWRRLAGAAAVVGVLGVGAATTAYAVQDRQLADERAATAAAQAQVGRVQAVLAAPDATLHRGALAGGGRASVVVSDSLDAGVVVLADAPPPGAGHVYQLWLVHGVQPVSVGLVPVGPGAPQLIRGVRGSDAFAVSLEPAGGSPAPTTTPLVGISLA